MKKLLACLMLLELLPCIALGEDAAGQTQGMEWAFGLFSVEIPAAWEVGPMESSVVADLCCNVSGLARPACANYAPLPLYAEDAAVRLEAQLPLLSVLCGSDCTAAAIAGETLPNSVTLRWQPLRGSDMHTLWFEAFITIPKGQPPGTGAARFHIMESLAASGVTGSSPEAPPRPGQQPSDAWWRRGRWR